MKNRVVYYLAITIPIVIIILLRMADLFTPTWFFSSLLIYASLYRTYTDGKRLMEKGLIAKKDIWKLIIPGQRMKYFKELYLR